MKSITALKNAVGFVTLMAAALPAALLVSTTVQAEPETYVLDTKANHAFIQFKIKHLGYSWLLGSFKTFTGEFTVDPNAIEKSSVKAEVDVTSLDSNNAERDKHLRSKDFFETDKYPKATFVSKEVKKTGDKTADITGDFTLKGVTKPITLKATYIGGGDDPWGGHRQGFELTGEIVLKDFNINYNLGPASQSALIYISAEGVKK